MTPLPPLALLAAIATLFLATPVAAQSQEDAFSMLEAASTARSEGDLAKAIDLYQQGDALLAADPAHQGLALLLIRGDLQRDIARTMREARQGDVCATLGRGADYIEQARAQMPANAGQEIRESLDYTAGTIARDQRMNRCVTNHPPVQIGPPDAGLVGHYYLSGMMETGSELLLKADGRFEWYISYGAVDQFARGRWGRDGKTVTLAADLPSADAPLFRADERAEWNEMAESRWRDQIRSRMEDAIALRCPWVSSSVVATSPASFGERPAAGPAEIAKAAEAKAEAIRARDEAGRAIAQAVLDTASDAERDSADMAMIRWHDALYAMEQAYSAASLEAPDIGSPPVPEQCKLPQEEDPGVIPREKRQDGIAIIVGNPAHEIRLSRVEVTFHYSDGHRESTKTGSGGWAFAPIRKGASVDRLELALPEPDTRPATLLPIAPMSEGIQTILVDMEQIVTPPFDVMRLGVEKGVLIPKDMPRGRYTRQ